MPSSTRAFDIDPPPAHAGAWGARLPRILRLLGRDWPAACAAAFLVLLVLAALAARRLARCAINLLLALTPSAGPAVGRTRRSDGVALRDRLALVAAAG